MGDFKFNVKVTSDLKDWSRLLERVKAASIARGEVGILEPKASTTATDGRLTLGEVGLINEFGSEKAHVPKRSFLRGSVTRNRTKVRDLMGLLGLKLINSNQPVGESFEQCGAQLKRLIEDEIISGIGKQNAVATIRKKGFNQPLIDSSQLVNAIDYRVMRNGGSVLVASNPEEYGPFEYYGPTQETGDDASSTQIGW